MRESKVVWSDPYNFTLLCFNVIKYDLGRKNCTYNLLIFKDRQVRRGSDRYFPLI